MKKWLIAASAVTFSVALVAGCGSNGTNSNNSGSSGATGQSSSSNNANSGGSGATTGINPADVKGSITVITQRTDLQQDGTLKKYGQEFMKAYPNVTAVHFQSLTNYAQDMKVRLSSGDYGDVLMIPTSVQDNQMPEFFAPLDNLGLDDSTYFGKYDATGGKTYGLVTGVDINGLIYNKKVFQKAGIKSPPKTLNSFYADLKKIKSVGVTPIALNYTAQWPLGNWINPLAIDIAGDPNYFNGWVGKKDPFQVDNAAGKALNVVYTIVKDKLAEPDYKVTDWEGSKAKFAQGKVGMMYLGNWAIPQFESKGIKSSDVGFAPMPTSNDASASVQNVIGPDYFMGVSKNSKNQATAKAFVKWWIEKSGYAQSQGFIPPLKSQKPGLPQLTQIEGGNTKLIQSVPTKSKLTKIENASQLDLGGATVQALLQEPTFSKAIAKLNQMWDNGLQQVG